MSHENWQEDRVAKELGEQFVFLNSKSFRQEKRKGRLFDVFPLANQVNRFHCR
jgi:hypothetical protein